MNIRWVIFLKYGQNLRTNNYSNNQFWSESSLNIITENELIFLKMGILVPWFFWQLIQESASIFYVYSPNIRTIFIKILDFRMFIKSCYGLKWKCLKINNSIFLAWLNLILFECRWPFAVMLPERVSSLFPTMIFLKINLSSRNYFYQILWVLCVDYALELFASRTLLEINQISQVQAGLVCCYPLQSYWEVFWTGAREYQI